MDIITYALSKKIAAHAISGVQSMSVNGQTLTINTKDSGVLTITFPTPKDGVSVTDIDVNTNNQIVFTMSDGTEIISGKIPTIKGDKGDPGVSPTITENADNTDKIYKLDITTADSTFTTPNLKGIGGEGASTWSEISDKPFESLSTDFSVENGELKVVGGTGEENTIESISVNGTPISIDENKNVDITVPKVTNDLTDELKSSYDDAVTAKHTHDNKTVLDGITAEKVESWDKAEENVQSDWNETDDTADGFIKNKPTIPDITGLATETYVDNKVADYTKTVDLADVATSGSYNDLVDKPTIPSLDGYAKTSEIPTKVSQLENDSNYLSSIPEEYVTDTELEAKGYLTEHQDISGKVDKVEGKSLISDTEIARLATVDNYDDTDIKAEIAKKADTTAIPSKVSELTNDSNYQTAEQVNSTVTTEIAKVVADAPEDLNTLKEMSDWIAGHEDDASAMNSAISDNKTAITALQTSKADKSEVPTTVAELTDSADYAKTADVNNSISTLQTDKADASDLTAHTDDADIHVTAENKATWNTVSDKVDKEDGKGLSANDYTNEEKALVGTIEDKINKTDIVTALDDTVTDEQVTSALLAKTELDKKVDKTSIATELSDASTDDEVVGALTAYNELQKLESANKEQFATVSGNFITVNDSVDGNIVDLKLYGKSKQKQYAGKNLLNATLETTTINGVTCTNNGDGTYTLNGTATGDAIFILFIASSSDNYVGNEYRLVGCPSGGSFTTYTLQKYEKDSIWGNDNGNGVNVTFNGGEINIAIIVYNSATVSNLVFKPMLTTDLDATYDDYEPYVGGIPSPNPSYPQEIKSVVNPVVNVCGKNLLKPTLGTTTQHGITCTANGDGTYTFNGTTTEDTCIRLGFFNTQKGVAYKLVGCPKGGGHFYKYCLYLPSLDLIDGGNGKTYIAQDKAKLDVFVAVYKGTTCNNLVFRPMITTDLNATYDDFVPYQEEQTATLPYTLNAIPVESGGNVTIDGQQYIADYVDIEKKQLVRCVGENINRITIWENTSGGGLGWYDLEISNTNFLCSLCKQYIKENDTAWDSTVPCFEIKKNIGAIRFYDTQNKNINVELMYDLATPTAIDLTDSEVQAFKELSTYYPTTSVFVTSEQLNGYAEFKYPTTDVSGLASRNESRIAELAKDTGDKFDDVNESLSVIGKCKNLLNPTLQTTTQNGVTCTNNGDGTYTLNGTATGNALFNLIPWSKIAVGNYRVVGCPIGGSEDGYNIQINAPKEDDINTFYNDIGNGVTFEVYNTVKDNIVIRIRVIGGTTVSNIIFKPMLTTDLNATYDDFVPYTGEGETLASDVAEIKNDLKDLGGMVTKQGHFGSNKTDFTLENLYEGFQQFMITTLYRATGEPNDCDGYIIIHKESSSGMKSFKVYGASGVTVSYDSSSNKITLTTTKPYMSLYVTSNKNFDIV